MNELKLYLAQKILANPHLSVWFKKSFGYNALPLIGWVEIWAAETIQKLPREKIRSFQLHRLKSIIDFAANNVPYWQNLKNFRAIGINDLPDIKKLPVLTRDKINSNPAAFLATGADLASAHCLSTSGSTNAPLRFYVDSDLFWRRAFAMRYALKIFGHDPWSRILRLNYKDMPWCSYQGQYFDLATEQNNIESFYEKIKKYNPEILYGTVSHLLWLVELVKTKPLNYRISCIVNRSEYLAPQNRKYLESTFGCKVFNIYASREFGPLAQECPQGNFHLNEQRFFFEVVDEIGNEVPDGVIGRILITSLENKTMPFIRYEIGDIGRFLKGSCDCGLKTRRIIFEGRSCDFIYLPNGGKLPLACFLYIVNIPGEIKAYQFSQKTSAGLTVRIVPGPDYKNEIQLKIQEEVKKVAGDNFNINIQLLDKIELLSNGKSKVLISEIKE